MSDSFAEFSATDRRRPIGWRRIAAVLGAIALALGISLELSGPRGAGFFVGTLCLLIGRGLLYEAGPARRRKKRLANAPQSTLREARGGFVEIRGKIGPSEEGLLTAPCSGRPAVWARIVVHDRDPESGPPVLDETAGRAFCVDDGSGPIARVVPARAHFELGPTGTGLLARDDLRQFGTWAKDFSPRLLAFLRSRGHDANDLDRLVVDEVLLEPGETVFAVGTLQRATAIEESAYREPSAPAIVMAAGDGEGGELVLANRPPRETEGSPRFAIGLVFIALGIVLAVASLVARS